METPDDVDLIADAIGVGQLVQVASGDAALDAVAVVLQQAQEARTVAFDVRGPVHRDAQVPATLEEGAQQAIDIARAQRKHGKVGIEHVQRRHRPFDACTEVHAEVLVARKRIHA